MTDGNGLLYMRARYYSPELKRFINADVLQGKIGDSDTLNRYAYVEGNPVSMVDPFGLCAEPGSKKKGSKGFLGKIKSTWHTGVRKVKSGYHTVVSGTKKFFSSWSVSDYIHTALDGLGMIPGGEAVFDGINAIYYLTEGDVMNAGMSGIALIPLVGEAAAGGKFATKTADGVGDVIKSSEKIGDAMQDTVKYVDDIADSGKYADDIAGSGKYVDEIIDGGSKSGSKSKWWHEGYVDDLSDTQMILGVKQSDKGLSTLGSATRENAMSAGKAWVGDNYNVIKDNSGNILGYSSADGMRAFRIQYKPKEGMWRANFQENIMVNNPYPNQGQHSSQLKNVHIDILD